MAISDVQYAATLASLNWPQREFDGDRVLETPDYSNPEQWAALPGMENGAAALPRGLRRVPAAELAADVFYIHPTTHPLSGYHGYGLDELTRIGGTAGWNQSTEDARTRKWVDDLLRKQASVFNSSCRIYAPRYRQANIMVLADLCVGNGRNSAAALALAYRDIRAAFEHYLARYNEGRPFIIAGHSQGSFHGQSLLRDYVCGKDLLERLVAAYLIGINITPEYLQSIPDIPFSRSPGDTSCLIGYRTWLHTESSNVEIRNINVNPLSWLNGDRPVSSEDHLGAVKLSLIEGDLSAPVGKACSAQCRQGVVMVEVSDPDLISEWPGQPGNLHAMDYDIFHMNLRRNVADRVRNFLLIEAG